MTQSRSSMSVPLAAALVALVATACSKADEGVAQGQIDNPVIVLSEGACADTCPVYDLTLHPDGSYLLNGRRFVKTEGVTSGNLGVEAWTDSEKVLDDARFWNLKPVQTHETLENCESGAPDVMITWRTAEGKEKTVTYNAGCGVTTMRTMIASLRQTMGFEDLVWTNAKFNPVTGQRD